MVGLPDSIVIFIKIRVIFTQFFSQCGVFSFSRFTMDLCVNIYMHACVCLHYRLLSSLVEHRGAHNRKTNWSIVIYIFHPQFRHKLLHNAKPLIPAIKSNDKLHNGTDFKYIVYHTHTHTYALISITRSIKLKNLEACGRAPWNYYHG